jgi:hypothetical protein
MRHICGKGEPILSPTRFAIPRDKKDGYSAAIGFLEAEKIYGGFLYSPPTSGG